MPRCDPDACLRAKLDGFDYVFKGEPQHYKLEALPSILKEKQCTTATTRPCKRARSVNFVGTAKETFIPSRFSDCELQLKYGCPDYYPSSKVGEFEKQQIKLS
ncbi:unnamed protein product [Durusdinium trenchii]|uniref:Uncharacterized protein n=1 Tax=Durusdinium trenchii TaxID=1381693 RepID=A0ABP0L7Z0_9DINO